MNLQFCVCTKEDHFRDWLRSVTLLPFWVLGNVVQTSFSRICKFICKTLYPDSSCCTPREQILHLCHRRLLLEMKFSASYFKASSSHRTLPQTGRHIPLIFVRQAVPWTNRPICCNDTFNKILPSFLCTGSLLWHHFWYLLWSLPGVCKWNRFSLSSSA